jgi:ectoine hydroxylase-related dioxygenase (phytanoyl-CoA dioxygenase family)
VNGDEGSHVNGKTVDADTIAAFRRDGAVVLRGVFADRVQSLRVGVAENVLAPSADARVYDGADGRGRFFGDYCNWERIPAFRALAFESPAASLAAALLGSAQVRLFHEHVLVKEPGADVPTPWHQDQPYYCVDGEQTVSFWIPLDPVPRDTTLEFVAGSHRWERSFRPERFDGTALVEDDDREAPPDIEGDRAAYPIIGWALDPGDAVAFSFRTLHGAPPNRRATSRRVVSLRLVGDDCRFAVRNGPTSPPFRDVTLADGAPLDDAAFPLLPLLAPPDRP